MKKVYIAETRNTPKVGKCMVCVRIERNIRGFDNLDEVLTTPVEKITQIEGNLMMVETANSTYYVLVRE